jgi:sodium-dependent dicarboxylate transporter 2/3/5
LFGFPVAVCFVGAGWVVLCLTLLRAGLYEGHTALGHLHAQPDAAQRFRHQFQSLGSLSVNQRRIACLFLALLVLWFCRDFGFAAGWASWFPRADYISDGTVVMLVSSLLFLIPHHEPAGGGPQARGRGARADADEEETACDGGDQKKQTTVEEEADAAAEGLGEAEGRTKERMLLGAEALQEVPWGTLLLLGGAFALAEGFSASGLTDCLATQLDSLHSLSYLPLMLVICGLASAMSEVSSNMATNTILQPIVLPSASLSLPVLLVSVYGLSVDPPVTWLLSWR